MTGRPAPFRRPDPGTEPAEHAQRDAKQREAHRRHVDRHARRLVDERADNPATAGAHYLVAEALMDTITDQVFEAIYSPDFIAALAAKGYTVAPALAAEDVQAPPPDWLHDAIDLVGAAGDWVDPLARLDELWRAAYRAGYEAANAARVGGTA